MTTPDVSLASWFAKRAARTPSRRALTFDDHTSTYAELWQRVERLAAGLRAGGVNAGHRVGFLGVNQPAFFETLLATSRLGAIFVPLNFRLTAAELAYIIGDAGVHTLIVDEPHGPVIDTARDDLNMARYVAADGHAAGWEPSFDPAACLADIARYGVTTFFGVPAMFLFLSQHPDFAPADLTSIRTVHLRRRTAPRALLHLYLDRGVPIQQGYGLTETAPMVTFLTAEHSLTKLGSAGRPPLFTEVRIADADNTTVTERLARGEVCVRGPNVLAGYWNRPDATAEAIDADGWFHTGDMGYLDADGFLFIADWVKDMVITGGENVYPAEVESVLFAYPTIAEVAVIGLPDQRWGETVTAVIVAKAQPPTLEDLREFAGRSLARYKLPTRLQFVDVLPRNPAGKVLKFELRDRFAEVAP